MALLVVIFGLEQEPNGLRLRARAHKLSCFKTFLCQLAMVQANKGIRVLMWISQLDYTDGQKEKMIKLKQL